MRPHFFITCDKSTPTHSTNQLIIIYPIVDGERVPIFVGAPLVYDTKDAELTGGTFKELGSKSISALKSCYYMMEEDLSYLVGVTADGAYQAVDSSQFDRRVFICCLGWCSLD